VSLIFITGISTAGKSTIAKELSGLGYEAHDTEHNGTSVWFSRVTGGRAAEFNECPNGQRNGSTNTNGALTQSK